MKEAKIKVLEWVSQTSTLFKNKNEQTNKLHKKSNK